MTHCTAVATEALRAELTTTHISTAHAALAVLMLFTPPGTAAAQGPSQGASLSVSKGVTLSQSAPRPGDVIRMRIWREPDLSGEFTVNELGDVVLPKLGTMHVSDISADSLRLRLVSSYTQFLRDPAIDVVVLRRVKVTGAVKNPGLYPADATMKLGDLVALAGGATPEGDLHKVRLSRAGDAHLVEVDLDQQLAESPVRSGDQLEVMERSWYKRNTGLLATTVSTAGFLIVTIIKR
jgi:polysaccharide export outer membrane protein